MVTKSGSIRIALTVPKLGDWIKNPTPPDDPEPDDYVHNRSITAIKGNAARILQFGSNFKTEDIKFKQLKLAGTSGSHNVWEVAWA